MSTIIKPFMGELISIASYDTTFDTENSIRNNRYKKGTFVRFEWLFIGDWKIDDPRLSNVGVKAEQNKGSASDEMAYEFEVNGWDMGSFPPTQGTDGDIRDGRTRIIAAIKKNQEWIPVALYNFEVTDTPVLDKVTEGLRANPQKPMTRSTTEDFIVAGIAAIDAGELDRDDPDAIMDWLVNDAAIGLRFSNEGGHYTRIVNWIIERTAGKDNLTKVLDREEWMTFLDGVQGINSKSVVLYKADGTKAAAHFWCEQVLPNPSGTVNLVIYSTAFTPEKCTKNVEGFIDDLTTLYNQTYGIVNADLTGDSPMAKIVLAPPSQLPFNIVGVCPNLKRGDQARYFEENLLVDYDQYINDGSPISSTLKVAP